MSKNPNIVLIMTDDQGPWALDCSGTPELRTPVLDQMAAEGMRFENFYCTSPVCSAARASILTGRIPSNHGVLDWLRGGAMKGAQKQKRIDPALSQGATDMDLMDLGGWKSVAMVRRYRKIVDERLDDVMDAFNEDGEEQASER